MVEDLNNSPPAEDDSHKLLLERRPWTLRVNRQLPLRFRDIPPQPLPPLQSATILRPPIEPSHVSASQPEGSESHHQSPMAQVISHPCCVVTPRNVFGLSREYYSTEIPSHDPEDQLSVQDWSNIGIRTDHPDTSPFYPYPNRNTFLLGDWYWNGGVQKSQASFAQLMEIVGSLDFRPEDVKDVNWHRINKELASDDTLEWMDEDAGWTQTPVTISVPYQRRRGVPCKRHVLCVKWSSGTPTGHVVNWIKDACRQHRYCGETPQCNVETKPKVQVCVYPLYILKGAAV
jgi:hypothetical protein